MRAAEIDEQHDAEHRVDEAEEAGVDAVEMIVGDSDRTEGESGQRAARRLMMNAIVEHAQRRLATRRSRAKK